jgi:hypothetical protein
VTACLEKHAQPDREIPAHLPGGTVFITVKSGSIGPDGPNFSGVAMRGPANIAFEAAVDPGDTRLPPKGS